MYLYDRQGDTISIYNIVPNEDKIRALKEKEVEVERSSFYTFTCPTAFELYHRRFYLKPLAPELKSVNMKKINFENWQEQKDAYSLWHNDLKTFEPLLLKLKDISGNKFISENFFQILSCNLTGDKTTFNFKLIEITKKLYILQTLMTRGLKGYDSLLGDLIDINKEELTDVLDCFDYDFKFSINADDFDKLCSIDQIKEVGEIYSSIKMLNKVEKSLVKKKATNNK